MKGSGIRQDKEDQQDSRYEKGIGGRDCHDRYCRTVYSAPRNVEEVIGRADFHVGGVSRDAAKVELGPPRVMLSEVEGSTSAGEALGCTVDPSLRSG